MLIKTPSKITKVLCFFPDRTSLKGLALGMLHLVLTVDFPREPYELS